MFWIYSLVIFFYEKQCLYLPYIHLYTHNLLPYYKAEDPANSVELLENLRFILSRCKE